MNPLTRLYGAGSGLRNTLFNRGVLRSRRLKQPVVSVGNLSVGGTGKTPFVIALGELLQQRGITFDILSRGYRRQTSGVLVVDPAGNAADFGDEPFLIARKLRVPVVVGESRYAAGLAAEKQFQTQLHILDDGFQHRSLARDFDIVLLAANDFQARLLPVGRLREPLSALHRADAIILPEGVATDHPALRNKSVWRMRREMQIANVPASPVVFCGIARPSQFFEQVRALGITPAAEIVFRDHHTYDQNDLQLLKEARSNSWGDGFVCTEKDAINLGDLKAELAPLSVGALKLSIDHSADLVDTILARIAERKPLS